MIDIDNELYDQVANALMTAFPSIHVTGEYVKAPSAFPSVSIVEIDNQAYTNTQDSSNMENHAILSYEINVYSNKKTGKKTQCRTIANVADASMAALGFSRTMLNPIPNLEDATIYRMLGRYTAVVSKDKKVYRR